MNETHKVSDKRGFLLYGAWFVSLIATLGSLYLSEIKGFIPCDLCWFQRIFMYPLVLILGIATLQNDWKVVRYALPLSVIGEASRSCITWNKRFRGSVVSGHV